MPSNSTFKLLFLLLSFGLIAAYSNQLLGQSTRQVTIVVRRIDTMNRQASDFERDNMGRDGKAKNNAETAKKTRQVRIEIEEDLKEPQTAYNNIVIAMNATRELRPGFAVTSAKLLRKNALRLKTNLILPDGDEGEEKGLRQSQKQNAVL